ncbi:MAG: hypothetical protein AAGI23_05905 [Bacteroidota bacterium]
MKKLTIIAAVLLLGIGGLMSSYIGLSRHIYNRTDCERFNIDNIELRTGINVPQVLAEECACQTDGKLKQTSFVIDTSVVDINDYISSQNWSLSSDGQYIASSINDRSEWQAQLDPQTAKLSFEIRYLGMK